MASGIAQENKEFVLTLKNTEGSRKFCVRLALLSIAGIPPLLGFFGKLGILIRVLTVSYFLFVAILASAPPRIFVYLRFVLLRLKLSSSK